VIGSALVAATLLASFVCTRAGEGPSLFWQERSITMQRSGGSAEVETAAIDDALAWAAAQWTNVDCSDITVGIGAPSDSRVVGFDWAAGSGSPDNENILIFRNTSPLNDDDPADPIDVWVHQLGALAITTVTFESGTGRLLDADVEMNDASFSFSACDPSDCDVEHDLKNTLTHELGHVLGLDHPPVNDPGASDATMFPSAAEGDVDKRDLAGDDVAGLCTLFPTGEPAGNCYQGTVREPPPEVRFNPTCAQTGVDPIVLMTLGVLARASLRRRIRRSPPDPLD
jgi:Matrixin